MYNFLQFLKSIADLFCETVELINSFQRYVDTLSNLKDKSMRVNGVKCDDCGNLKHIRYNLSDKYPSSREIPDSWFVVVKSEEGSLHFCSLGCLRAWTIKQSMEQV
jgi:hypothetical protein